MISLETAQELVLAACSPLPTRTVSAGEALGCVTADVVIANCQVPAFANSAMDGFAVRSQDLITLPRRLHVVTTIAAGTASERPIQGGEAARIMTGAPLPQGADSVCPVEQTCCGPDTASVDILTRLRWGANVRYPGEDVRPGEELIKPRTQLSPAHIGLLASVGVDCVTVIPSPRVGVLSTGDELVTGQDPLEPGKIRDANRHALLSAVRQMGCVPIDLGMVGDDEERVGSALEVATSSCDAIITSGGVSVGDFDIMRIVLERTCGRSMRWLQIAIKPGKPFAFGMLDPSMTPVFALSGNPVAALVCFELLVHPAIRQLGGHRLLHHLVLRATASSPIRRKRDGKLHAIRAIAFIDGSGQLYVQPFGPQGSHLLRAMADTNALVLMPDGEGVDAGTAVEILIPAIDRIERVEHFQHERYGGH